MKEAVSLAPVAARRSTEAPRLTVARHGRSARRVLAGLAWGIAIAACGPAFGQSLTPTRDALSVTDRIIVKYRNDPAGAPVAQSTARVTASGATAAGVPSTPAPALSADKKSRLSSRLAESTLMVAAEKPTPYGARVVSLGRMVNTTEAAQIGRRLAADDPDIEYAVPDRFIYLAQVPNDPQYAAQWALYERVGGVRAPGAWVLHGLMRHARRHEADFPIVAVVDTGYRPHVDLAEPYLGRDYLADGSRPLDTGDGRTATDCPNLPWAQASSWHGLSVEGLIAARLNNSTGVTGVASQAAGVLHSRVFGPCGGYLSSYIAAIHDAVDFRGPQGQRVRVINLSQSGPAACEAPLQQAINRALQAGVLVVASAGNDNQEVSRSSPANCAGVVSVAATDRAGNRAVYSNYGAGVTLAAPGGEAYGPSPADGLLTTFLNLPGTEPTGQQASDYAFVQGTSFSAPHVSAAAAMLFSLSPELTPAEVKTLLVRSARPLPGSCVNGCGAGLLDVQRAVERLHRYKISQLLCSIWPQAFGFCQRQVGEDGNP